MNGGFEAGVQGDAALPRLGGGGVSGPEAALGLAAGGLSRLQGVMGLAPTGFGGGEGVQQGDPPAFDLLRRLPRQIQGAQGACAVVFQDGKPL